MSGTRWNKVSPIPGVLRGSPLESAGLGPQVRGPRPGALVDASPRRGPRPRPSAREGPFHRPPPRGPWHPPRQPRPPSALRVLLRVKNHPPRVHPPLVRFVGSRRRLAPRAAPRSGAPRLRGGRASETSDGGPPKTVAAAPGRTTPSPVKKLEQEEQDTPAGPLRPGRIPRQPPTEAASTERRGPGRARSRRTRYVGLGRGGGSASSGLEGGSPPSWWSPSAASAAASPLPLGGPRGGAVAAAGGSGWA